MRRKITQFALVISILLPSFIWAAQQQFSPGKLVQVDRKTRERVSMYLVNNPVATEVPYYEITVRVGQTDYRAEYTPRHPEEELPDAWVNGAEVSVRLEKHHLLLKRPDGSELQWILLKKSPVKD